MSTIEIIAKQIVEINNGSIDDMLLIQEQATGDNVVYTHVTSLVQEQVSVDDVVYTYVIDFTTNTGTWYATLFDVGKDGVMTCVATFDKCSWGELQHARELTKSFTPTNAFA